MDYIIKSYAAHSNDLAVQRTKNTVTHLINVLHRNGVYTLADFYQKTPKEIRFSREMGPITYGLCIRALDYYGCETAKHHEYVKTLSERDVAGFYETDWEM